MDKSNNKIAIVSSSLGKGGAERFAGLLSCILQNSRYEVHNIIINDCVDYQYCGSLYNLGRLCDRTNYFSRKINKGILLQRYLKAQNINIIIDNRSRNVFIRELMVRWIYGNRERYYVIHSYNLKNYLPDSPILARILYGNAKKLVCVSKAIAAKVFQKYHLKNTITIYNPVDIVQTVAPPSIPTPEKYILFFGRFDQVKNFPLLLQAFSISNLAANGYTLLLMGEGPDRALIETNIDKFELRGFVEILPFRKDPYGIVKNARFTILTSRFEGFPMSLIESLACGTPVISVNCDSGPSEIIENEQNGLLVENHSVEALANAMNRFADDSVLYDICKNNAVKSVQHLSVAAISKQWQNLLIK